MKDSEKEKNSQSPSRQRFSQLPFDACELYMTYCLKHYELKKHPSPIGNGWELVHGKCRAVRYALFALPERPPMHNNQSDTDSCESDIDDSTDFQSSTDDSLYNISEY